MGLEGLDVLTAEVDGSRPAVAVAAAGGDDPSVLIALRRAADRGWVAPRLVGPAEAIRQAATAAGVDLTGFTLVDAGAEEVAAAAVAEVRSGRARVLMKGRVATPVLLRAVLDPGLGLRTGRVVCQVVLMELPRDGRRFLMADTGICVRPGVAQKADILRALVEVAHALGSDNPGVAVVAATEAVNPSMPETLHAAELEGRQRAGEFPGCVVRGPLSFDLAYSADSGGAKGVGGAVVGAADAMLFPDLCSANLTVKAIMYTADCRFGGVLRGTAAPVAFMSRSDSVATRLHSLALALRLLGRGA